MQGFYSHPLIHTYDQVWSKSNQVWCGSRLSNIWPQNYANLTVVIIACVQITLTLVNKWPRFKYILSVNANSKLIIQCSPQTHIMLINHTEIQNHLTRKYEKVATRNVQLAKYELNWTRKLKLATRTFQLATRNSNSQLELATRTRNSNSQLATCNSQNTLTPAFTWYTRNCL